MASPEIILSQMLIQEGQLSNTDERMHTLSKLVRFGLILYVSVNSYGQVETVSSPNNTFSWQA